MVNVVVLSAGPEGNEVVKTPWEIIAAVSIDSLEETGCNPKVHGQDVEVTGDKAENDGDDDCSSAEYHGFDRRGVLGSETKRSRVLVVNLMNVLVEEAEVKETVHPVMPCILQDKEDGDLDADCLPGRERNTGIHAARDSHWVEEPDLRELDGEVTEEYEFCARPLFLDGWDLLPLKLPLVEVRYPVDYDPRKTSAKVDSLVHDETHDSGCEDIVLHVGIPTLYCALALSGGG